jgi:hypothetical protein
MSDTWVWDGTSWTQHDVPGPGRRARAAMATLNNTVVLFGGESPDLGNELGDTWIWDGSTWTQAKVDGPPPTEFPAMTSVNGKVILCGSRQDGGGCADGTWIWDGSSWTKVLAGGPPGLNVKVFDFVGTLASLGQVGVLWGGTSDTSVGADPPGLSSGYSTITWTWNGTTWAQSFVASPSGREQFAMATLGSSIVLFGGLCQGCGDALFADTWTYDGTSWAAQNVAGPSPRYGHAMAAW